MGRLGWFAGLILIWSSVFTISYGAHLRSLDPRFAEQERKELEREASTIDAETPSWLFAACFSGFFATLFTAGSLVVLALGRFHREWALLAAGAFALGCLVGAALGVGEALRNVVAGFDMLGFGFLLSSAGLGVGASGLVWSRLALRSPAGKDSTKTP